MKSEGVKKNFIYSSFYQILLVLVPFVTGPYVARVLGAEMIGLQSFTTTNQSYFVMFAALGTITYGAREISRNRDNEYLRSRIFWEIELMTIMTSLVVSVFWGVLIIFCSPENRIYYIVLSMGLLNTALDISWFFSGLEQFRLIVIRNSFFKILGIVLLFTLIKKPSDMLLYMIILNATTLLSTMSFWPFLPRFIKKVPIKDLRIMPHFKETLVYFIPTIASSVYLMLDKTLLGLITGDNEEIGFYQEAERIIAIAKSLVFTAVGAVVGVRISYLFAEEKYDEIKRRIDNSMNYILFMGAGCCFGIIAVAVNLVPVYFGPGFDMVVPLLFLFSPIILIIGVSNCLGSHYYTPAGKRKQSAKYIIGGSVLNLVLNSFLIPFFSALGAAVASIAAECLITVLYLKKCNGYMTASRLLDISVKKIAAGFLMAVIVNLIGMIPGISQLVTLVIQVISGILIYVLMLFVLKDKWTIDFIGGTIKKVMERLKHGKA